jgi:tRNA-dihydrouridine synthase B
MRIGSLKLKGKLLLAPMVNVSDLAFRLLCKKHGAALTYTEMIVINSLVQQNETAKRDVMTCDKESPNAIQIAGHDLKLFKKAIPYCKPFDLIDVNFGCPVRKAEQSGIGAVLLDRPNHMKKIIQTLKENTDKPVTAKVRLGNNKNNILEIAEAVEQSGADAICVHPRTAETKRGDKAEWKWIREVKERVSIPVIGNGDVLSGNNAKDMLKKADFAMIARGAIGDPHIFTRLNAFLKDGTVIDMPTLEMKRKMFYEYYKLAQKYDLDYFPRMREHAQYFMRGVKGASKIRQEINSLKKMEDLTKYIDSLE